MPKKRKKRPPKDIAFDKLVDTFQVYIRWRDKWTCICCGLHIDPYAEKAKWHMHAGHYIPRGKKSLLLDEVNVNAQCKECNSYSHWQDNNRYAIKMLEKYGKDVLDDLERRKWELAPKYALEDIKELTDTYLKKINKLKKDYDMSSFL